VAAPAAPGDPPLAPPDKQPPTLSVPTREEQVGWAIVGLGQLTLEEILPAFGTCKSSYPAALVSGHPEKARQLAEVHGVEAQAIYGYEDFDRIKDNGSIQVVYIVLPNSMHAEYTIRGLQAGKHVLCEKPMAASLAECEAMIDASRKAGKVLGVAYRLHYEPMNLTVMEMCRKKAFGKIKTFTASNCQNVKAPNIRLSGPLGGGPVGDVGVYCINAARYTIGEEPVEAIALQRQPDEDPRFREVPESVSFLLRYPSGVVAACECSFGTARSSSYQVLCENGSIQMNPAYTYSGLRLFTTSSKEDTPRRTELLIEQVDQFAAEMDAFSRCVLENKPVPTPGEMGLWDMRIVLAVMESARLGGVPVKI
jgi:predicted dehydrogenase